MNRSVLVTAVAAVLVGVLAGFLWWGRPTIRLQTELRNAQTNAERLGQQLGELRAENQRLETQLKTEKSRLESARADLSREQAMNARLQRLVGQGKK